MLYGLTQRATRRRALGGLRAPAVTMTTVTSETKTNGAAAGEGERVGQLPSLLKFWAARKFAEKIFFLCKNFRPKVQNLEPKTPIFRKFMRKIQILITHNLLCQKFAAVCRNSVGDLECMTEENCSFVNRLLLLTHDVKKQNNVKALRSVIRYDQ